MSKEFGVWYVSSFIALNIRISTTEILKVNKKKKKTSYKTEPAE